VSELIIAEGDPDVVLAEALALYKATTGVTLQPADPKRLHLQTLLLLLAQARSLIDFSGKQSLLRFVSALYIDALAELWGDAAAKLPALPSTCTQRFNFATSAARTIAAGTRVTDGTSLWQVTEDTSATADHIDAPVECTVAGGDSNGIAIGQIDTLVDPDQVVGCTGTENTTATISGRDIESLEDQRERMRDVPESTSTCGPRTAYNALSLAASASVADAVALGPDDAGDMAGTPPDPGEVFVLVIQGERDAGGVLTSVVPTPEAGLLTTVDEALSAEDVRPLGDSLTVKAPAFVEFDCVITYYIARSRSDSAADIQDAVDDAYDAYLLWQQSKIGRDINPSEANRLICNAGAKRTVISSPSFVSLDRDESAIADYVQLVYGGVEDD